MALVSPTNSTITYAELITETDIQQWVTSLVALASFLRNGAAYTTLANGAEMLPNWGARAHNTANITISHNTWTDITFNSESSDYDSGTIHSTSSNTQNFTCPVAGKYLCAARVIWTANATGYRGLAIYKAGVQQAEARESTPGAADNPFISDAWVVTCAASDVIVFKAYQNSGGNLDIITSGLYGIAGLVQWIGV